MIAPVLGAVSGRGIGWASSRPRCGLLFVVMAEGLVEERFEVSS